MSTPSPKPANDASTRDSGADPVSATHLEIRRVPRRGIRITSVLAIALLGFTAVQVYLAMRPEPDLVTFAFRV